MYHFTPPSPARVDRQRPTQATSPQVIPSAELSDRAAFAFSAGILDPMTGQGLTPRPRPAPGEGGRAEGGDERQGQVARESGGSDSALSSFDPLSALPLRSSPPRPTGAAPRGRPSLPELQARTMQSQSPRTEERGQPVLSRHASEGTFQAGMRDESEHTTVPAESRARDGTASHEEVGSFGGMGHDLLASTPPVQNGSTLNMSLPPHRTPVTQGQAPQPVVVPRVAVPHSPSQSASASFVQPSHLPPLKPGQSGPTAMQNWDVSGEMEYTLAKVVRPEVVDEVLEKPDTLRKLREFIEMKGSDPLLLDFYNDLKLLSDLSAHLRLGSFSILQTYLMKSSPFRLVLPISLRGPILACLMQTASLNLELLPPLHELRDSLFEREFKPYLQQKLVEHVVARLGSWKAGYGWTGATALAPNMASDGLADCYCLTNPRLKDNPIVLASHGFAQLTGYPLDAIIARNCRFLQGPGTAPESTLKLREALNAGEGTTSLILNYRANGTPFYNLLCMLPLKDSSGLVKYFLGGQIDVTGAISSLSSLAVPAFASSALSGSASSPSQPTQRPHFTPFVQARVDRLETATRAGRIDPAMNATSAAELVANGGTGGNTTLVQHHELLFGSAKGEDVKGKGKAKEDDGGEGRDGEEEGRASSGSTLSIHPSQSAQAGSLGHIAGAGVRAAADAIAHVAAEGAKKMKKVASKDSYIARRSDGTGRADWAAEGKEGDEACENTREREKKSAKAEGKQKDGPLMVKLHHFEATYSRVMLVHQSTREVLFCTPELVDYCGLPPSAQFDLTSVDFIKTLFAITSFASSLATSFAPAATVGKANGAEFRAEQHEDEEHTRRLRRNVRLAIESGHPWTGLVGLKPVGKGGKIFTKHRYGDVKIRVCVLHLTPLCDRDGNCEAFG
ncbi:hypothetical protein JCM11251_006317 [Rhodosporidiobolus azoricus]